VTLAGGIVVGAILLRSLLFYPQTLGPLQQGDNAIMQK
jgi:hypothetical protein